MQENLLVQKIEHDNGVFDLSFIIDFTYTEKTDLSGPIIIMQFNDRFSYLRDIVGVREKDEITVTIHDVFHSDTLHIVEKFTIESMPMDNNENIEFTCTSSVVNALKIHATQAELFVQKPVSAIIRRLVDADNFDIGRFPVVNDYHLLPGMRPSKLIRQMAKECGALAFYRRGTFVFKSIDEMVSSKPTLTQFFLNDSREENQVLSYKVDRNREAFKEAAERHYTGFDMEKGVVSSRFHKASPIALSGLPSKVSLDNLAKLIAPTLTFNATGNGGMQAGDTLDFVWGKVDIESPTDESLPEKGFISSCAHHYSPHKYLCQAVISEVISD